MTQALIHDLLVILAGGLFAAIVCRRLRVSVLIGYLVVGALLGQGALGWVRGGDHQLEQFAEAGVFLLLFSIGLEFSLDDLRQLGRSLLIGGMTQMLLVILPSTGVLLWLGMQWQPAVLVATALSFSSTVLVFKALSEWGQSEQPHGKRAIGILLFQDAALIPILLLVPLLTGGEQKASLAAYGSLTLVSILFVFAVVGARSILSTWLIPALASYRSPELVILFTLVSLGWLTLAAYAWGLPPAVGAFAAGLIFNGNRWTRQIDALILPFRESFAAVFFIGLGLIFDPRLLWKEPIWMLLTLSAIVFIKTLAAAIAFRLSGLSLRSALGMGIGLAHVGEFAFVLVLLGLEARVLSIDEYQRVVAIAVGSLILTPFLLKAGLDYVHTEEEEPATAAIESLPPAGARRATVMGAGPIGRQVASQLEIEGMDVCLIDLSPINLHPFAQEGFRTIAGDATDSNILSLAAVRESVLTAVCVPQDESAIRIVQAVRRMNPRGRLVVRCRYQTNAEKLRRVGADDVVSEEAEASVALLRILTRLEQASR